MKRVLWPRYMRDKCLAGGRLAYYWTPRRKDLEAGFPLKAQSLGTDYTEAVRRCDGDPNVPGDRGLNGALDDWRRGLPLATGAPVHGTLKWLFHRYQQTRAFTRLSERVQKDYRRFLELVTASPLKTGATLGDLALESISARAIDILYDNLSAPGKRTSQARQPRKSKIPAALESKTPQKRLRQANKCIDVARWAWLTVRRLHPAVVPSDNPFEGVTREYSNKETEPATRAQTYALAEKLADLGHPGLGLCALVAFEWHQRPENVLSGHLQWAHYRSPNRPNAVRVIHAKNDQRIWLPLEDKDGPLFPEIETFIANVPRLAPAMVVTPGLKGKPRLYTFYYARGLVRRARREAGLPEHVTLAACRHGGMTELGDSEITEQGVMSLSGHKTPAAARLYIKRTEKQRLMAARRRRAFLEALEAEHNETESRNAAALRESE
jgi:hypothetical protein